MARTFEHTESITNWRAGEDIVWICEIVGVKLEEGLLYSKPSRPMETCTYNGSSKYPYIGEDLVWWRPNWAFELEVRVWIGYSLLEKGHLQGALAWWYVAMGGPSSSTYMCCMCLFSQSFPFLTPFDFRSRISTIHTNWRNLARSHFIKQYTPKRLVICGSFSWQ